MSLSRAKFQLFIKDDNFQLAFTPAGHIELSSERIVYSGILFGLIWLGSF